MVRRGFERGLTIRRSEESCDEATFGSGALLSLASNPGNVGVIRQRTQNVQLTAAFAVCLEASEVAFPYHAQYRFRAQRTD